ncbi:peptidylprolyl isomerase [Ideonella sp. BN130291]|uniref:peptidylprolyl isomerase n=1 Tax=Ideonella sp. BN130291 TaxID=3112940 RepID=UPI002E25FC91|nr:peptidylprolyl isomerase [Ideonella sp. BN130291]
MQTDTLIAVARVRGVALHQQGEQLGPEALRERACTELLRQRAQQAGLLAADDSVHADAVLSAAAADAIERLLERELQLPEPEEAACRRHHAANIKRYSTGERVHARHVLFAVTDGVDLNALRRVAEQTLLDLRAEPGRFAERAAQQSNCPSAAQGGDLGWLTRDDCAEEFARELFAHTEVGVLPRLVHSRFGLHVVEVLQRNPGTAQPYEAVRGAVALALRQQVYVTALRQYLQLLAADADIVGVDLAASDSPLVQ